MVNRINLKEVEIDLEGDVVYAASSLPIFLLAIDGATGNKLFDRYLTGITTAPANYNSLRSITWDPSI